MMTPRRDDPLRHHPLRRLRPTRFWPRRPLPGVCRRQGCVRLSPYAAFSGPYGCCILRRSGRFFCFRLANGRLSSSPPSGHYGWLASFSLKCSCCTGWLALVCHALAAPFCTMPKRVMRMRNTGWASCFNVAMPACRGVWPCRCLLCTCRGSDGRS